MASTKPPRAHVNRPQRLIRGNTLLSWQNIGWLLPRRPSGVQAPAKLVTTNRKPGLQLAIPPIKSNPALSYFTGVVLDGTLILRGRPLS